MSSFSWPLHTAAPTILSAWPCYGAGLAFNEDGDEVWAGGIGCRTGSWQHGMNVVRARATDCGWCYRCVGQP